MRLTINRDEVASFRRLVRRALDSGTETVEITLRMPKEDAESMLARSDDDGPAIECVWNCGFSAERRS